MTQEIQNLIQLEQSTLGSDYIAQSEGYYREYLSDEGLTEEEFLVVRMLVSNGGKLIQRHLFEGSAPTQLESLLCGYLDSAIEKMHIEDTTDVVYRVVKTNEFNDSQVNTVITKNEYLTASKFRLSVTGRNVVYIIQLAGRTQARSLYRAYEVTPFAREFQVEFPRGTKFHVDGIEQEGDITVVRLTEVPENVLPVELLTSNVSEFFQLVKAIDIQAVIKRGLKNRIKFMKSISGENINARCALDGQVYVSPTFAQAVWNMCYAGLALSERVIVDEEAQKNESSLDKLYKEIVDNNCEEPECLYIKGIAESRDWSEMVEKAVAYRRNWNNTQDDVEMSRFDLYDTFNGRIGTLYKAGMGTVLLHELTHYNHDHFDNMEEPRQDKEQDADDTAFDAILLLENRNDRKAAVLGMLSVYLLAFFNNSTLAPSAYYYREDIRLFRQYDKIIDFKREASIMVANVLSKWLQDYHYITINVEYGHEEDAVNRIREEIQNL